MNNEKLSLRYPTNKSAQPLGKHAIFLLTHGTRGKPRKENLPTKRIAPVRSRALLKYEPHSPKLSLSLQSKKNFSRAPTDTRWMPQPSRRPSAYKPRPLALHTFDQTQRKKKITMTTTKIGMNTRFPNTQQQIRTAPGPAIPQSCRRRLSFFVALAPNSPSLVINSVAE